MALEDLPGWQAYYDRQLALLRTLGAPRESAQTLSQEEWMRQQDERQARSDEAHRLRAEVLAALRPSDVVELVDAIGGDEMTVEQRPLVFLIADLVASNDPRLANADRERFAMMLERMMRHAYPRDGGLYWFLRGLDPERAATALLAAIDRIGPSALTPKEAELAARDLAGIGGRGLSVLQQLAMLGGEIGAIAVKRLEGLGHVAPALIAEVAARWRRARQRDELNWLYNTVISRFGEGGEPISRLRDMLGEPSGTLSNMLTWVTDEAHPIALNVGFDDRGMIVSYKLK
jgi:hypothetical protein